MKTLQIYIDFKSPAAYLAVQPTLVLAQRLPLELIWRPLPVAWQSVPEVQTDEDTGARHRRVRAQARRTTHLHYAAVQGVPMSFPQGEVNTDLCLAALQQMAHVPQHFITSAFLAFWRDNRNLNEPAVVTELLQLCDIQLPDVSSWDVASLLEQARAAGIEAGAMDVPAYLIDEQLFIGREHLPWITQIGSDLGSDSGSDLGSDQ